jgi:MinD-like ATPase involved in chromosome partitioning or flagellar assembly
MMRVRVVTIAGTAEQEPSLAARIGTEPDADLVLRCVDRVELTGAIRGGDLDAIIAVGLPHWMALEDVEEAARREIRLLVVTDDPRERERGEALGAMLMSASTELADILAGARTGEIPTPRQAFEIGGPSGRVIAIWGPKGAPGRTSVAIELACELAANDASTMLVDADPYGGDVLQLVGVDEELPTIVWAARMAAKGELDGTWIARDLRRVGASGPVLLPGLARSGLWAEVSAAGWDRLLEIARGLFRQVVCDTGFCLEPESGTSLGGDHGRNRMARAALSGADHVVAVFRADPVGIKNLVLGFQDLIDLVPAERVMLVANRVRDGDQRRVGELTRAHLGKRPIAYLPEEAEEMYRAVLAGAPVAELAPGSDLMSGIRAIASALGSNVRPRGLLARLGGRA